MKKEIRTVVYDESLRIEAYRFEGIVQPFPNHFHEHYVIGFVENGERSLSCRNIDYTIGQGSVDLLRFTDMKNLFNILYLGIEASALCFVTWNYAVKVLGAVKTSIYIYMIPVITIITSMLVLKEKVTFLSIAGTILAVVGLFLSEYNRTGSKKDE